MKQGIKLQLTLDSSDLLAQISQDPAGIHMYWNFNQIFTISDLDDISLC